MKMWEYQRRAIIDALIETEGDISHAAQRLGIARATIYRKIKEYDIPLSSKKERNLEDHNVRYE